MTKKNKVQICTSPQTLLAFVGLTFFIVGCASKGKDSTEKELSTSKKQTQTATQVHTAEAVRKPFAFRVLGVGKIEARQHTEVYSKREGIIAKIYVRNGQAVRQGEPIADLDKTELELQVRKSRANLALKQVQYQDKILEYNHKISNEKELSAELRQRFRATSGLEEAELALQEAELNLSYCKIVAPFAGKIADLKMKEGNRLSIALPLCVVYSAHALEAVTEVLESQASKLQIGQSAEVGTTSEEKYAYQATIVEINPKVTANGLVRVKLAIASPNAEGTNALLQGMNIRVKITAPQAEAVVVPKEAVVMRSGRKVVFVAEAGEAKWHYVSTGAENQTEIAIVEGLEAGKAVIISNNLQLVHDSPVVVIKK
jgi:RND family efflux transporter MFP subunit